VKARTGGVAVAFSNTEGYYELKPHDRSFKLDPASAKHEVRLQQVTINGQPTIYVDAIAENGDAHQQGVLPGMRLRGISDPLKKNEIWPISGKEKLRFVRSNFDCSGLWVEMVFDGDEASFVTAEEVARAEAIANQYIEETQKPGYVAPEPTAIARDRPDLFTKDWDGEVYTGSRWNELTILLAIAFATPMIGLAYAILGRGTVWDLQ